MNDLSDIKYAKSTAGEAQMLAHFEKCDTNFVELLSQKINIKEYAVKIITNAVTFEAWNNNELAGLLAVYFNDIEKKTGFITNVSIAKTYEGNGIGSGLINMCIEYGKLNNYQYISLEVNKESHTAIHLYSKYGFIKTAETGDSLLMSLKL
jgi:ribosomal protein S18 acetylase RimI-like enzyme